MADEYRLFLQHLIALDHLARMDEGALIVGMKGAQVTSNYHFYAIFANEQECRVLAGTQEIGTIQHIPVVASIIGLAGYAWLVTSVDERRRTIQVERAKDVIQPGWLNTSDVFFHQHIMERLRLVLQEEVIYAYLSPLAQRRLALARDFVRSAGWLHSCVVALEPGRFVLLPWAGSRIHRTLAHILKYTGWSTNLPGSGYYIEVVRDVNKTDLLAELWRLSPQVSDLVRRLVTDLKDIQLWHGKYDYLAPRTLLEKAYVNNVLDVAGTKQWLATCS